MGSGDNEKTLIQDQTDTGERVLLMEQFRLCIESANLVSDLRARANTYFVTICAGLVAFIGSAIGKFPWYTIALLCLGGVIVSYTWIGLLHSYRRLNAAKFQVICELEEKLPAQPFASEWKYLHPDIAKKPHTPLSQREKNIPFAFIALFIVMGILAATVRTNQILRNTRAGGISDSVRTSASDLKE